MWSEYEYDRGNSIVSATMDEEEKQVRKLFDAIGEENERLRRIHLKDKKKAERRFLEAWIDAVILIGPQYFKAKEGFKDVKPHQAKSRYQLIPDISLIERDVNTMPKRKQVLVSHVLSNYDEDIAERITRIFLPENQNPFSLNTYVTQDMYELFARLGLNNAGW